MDIKLSELTLDQFTNLNKLILNNFETIEDKLALVAIVTKQTLDEAEDMELSEFNEILKTFNIYDEDAISLPLKTEFEIDGIKFKSSDKDTFSFNIKQITLSDALIKREPVNFLPELSAIIFKQVGEDGKVIRDYTEEGIAKRTKLFNEKLTLDIILPYLQRLTEYTKKW